MRTSSSRALGRKKFRLLLLVVALMMVASGTALAVTYTTSKKASLKLNRGNFVGTALTVLASNAVGPVLTLDTDNTDSSSTPLALKVQDSSQAPMTVDSETKVTNLNADKIDDKSSESFLASDGKAVDAAHADSADNADTLDGINSIDFLRPKASRTLNFQNPNFSIAAHSCTQVFASVTGMAAGDVVLPFAHPNLPSGLTLTGLVQDDALSQANQATFRMCNVTDSAISANGGSVTIFVIKQPFN